MPPRPATASRRQPAMVAPTLRFAMSSPLYRLGGWDPFRLNGAVLQKPAELKEVIEAERVGTPFLVFRDGEDAQQLLTLDSERQRVTVGRSLANDLCLDWDTEVSRLHAEIER